MTHNTREVEEIGDILIELTDATGFDHTPEALFAFERAKEKLHHQLQKARHDWLREEIVRLEGMKEEMESSFDYEVGEQIAYGYVDALQTIIDRYKEELDQDKQ